MTEKIEISFTKSELSMLVTILHMGGWQRKKNLPQNSRNSENKFINKMSKILKKLEDLLDDD
jgi:hypothetical protein